MGLFFACYEWNSLRVLIFGSVNFDFGSVTALFATLAIILLFKIDEDVKNKCGLAIGGKNDKSDTSGKGAYTLGIIILLLAIVSLIATWLSIRIIGLTFQRYIIQK